MVGLGRRGRCACCRLLGAALCCAAAPQLLQPLLVHVHLLHHGWWVGAAQLARFAAQRSTAQHSTAATKQARQVGGYLVAFKPTTQTPPAAQIMSYRAGLHGWPPQPCTQAKRCSGTSGPPVVRTSRGRKRRASAESSSGCRPATVLPTSLDPCAHCGQITAMWQTVRQHSKGPQTAVPAVHARGRYGSVKAWCAQHVVWPTAASPPAGGRCAVGRRSRPQTVPWRAPTRPWVQQRAEQRG